MVKAHLHDTISRIRFLLLRMWSNNSACQKLSVHAEMISNYLQKVEKSLQRTNNVLENSKLEELLSVQKVIDDDIGMLQSERTQNLISSFQVQLDDTQSCLEMLSFHSTLRELADKCKYVYLFRFCANNGIIYQYNWWGA
jgi:hypothetical protein